MVEGAEQNGEGTGEENEPALAPGSEPALAPAPSSSSSLRDF